MGSGLGHAEAFPKRSTQCLVPYSENKGYASNPRRSVLSNRLSVLILYFNAAKFSIKLFHFIYLTVYVVSQQDKYEIMTETRPFKNS